MASDIPLLVFTDLDGTLIDHETYSWEAARPALDALRKISAGVVLASSKTAAEMSPLRRSLGLTGWPAIVENGAGVLPAGLDDVQANSRYDEILEALDTLPADLRALFKGFGTSSVQDVIDMTGLSPEGAKLAQDRAFSEPGLWQGDSEQTSRFLGHLDAVGLVAQQGGRFLTLSFGGNKVDQMQAIIDANTPKHTIALGDAPNDIKMIEHADFGVVIANPHRAALPRLAAEENGHILRTTSPGPTGWSDAMFTLLSRLNLI